MYKIGVGVIVILLLSVGGFALLNSQQAGGTAPGTAPSAVPAGTTAVATTSAVTNSTTSTDAAKPGANAVVDSASGNLVVADARVVPVNNVSLHFVASQGTVAQVMVKEGDRVEVGAPLARLDTRGLELQIQDAQTKVTVAKANYDQLIAGPSAAKVRQAQSGVDQAQGQLRQTQGSVTQADITAAQATLKQSQAALQQLEAGPESEEIRAAQADIDQAQAELQSKRDALSATKTAANGDVEKAANKLRDLQAEYSQIYWANQGIDPKKLDQTEIDKEAAALRAVQNASVELDQARVAYEQAVKAEITGVAAAQTQVDQAQAKFDLLVKGPRADEIAAAQAKVAEAQADLTKLQGEQRAGTLAAAAANVKGAQSAVDVLKSPPTASDIATAKAQVQSAETELAQAQLDLDKATLRAPIAGTVAIVNIKPGELASDTSEITIADFSSWQIVSNNLSELSIRRVSEGDHATISFYALPGLQLTGKVMRITTVGSNTNDQGADTTYSMIITPDRMDARLRWNMTASVVVKPSA